MELTECEKWIMDVNRTGEIALPDFESEEERIDYVRAVAKCLTKNAEKLRIRSTSVNDKYSFLEEYVEFPSMCTSRKYVIDMTKRKITVFVICYSGVLKTMVRLDGSKRLSVTELEQVVSVECG